MAKSKQQIRVDKTISLLKKRIKNYEEDMSAFALEFFFTIERNSDNFDDNYEFYENRITEISWNIIRLKEILNTLTID